MFRNTIVRVLIVIGALVAASWLSGCSQEQAAGPVGDEKAYLGNQPDPESLVDTHILDGELDEEFPEDQQVYPYYVVRHGPEAGVYSFSEGDTVPDGAYVVLKARASTEEPAPKNFNVQGLFKASQQIRVDGIWFTFFSNYSRADLKPSWHDPQRGLAADTLGFEVGPFHYDVAMRGILNLGDEQYRDASPDTLSFVGNYPPCVQCIELGNVHLEPGVQYEDPCYEQSCLAESPVLRIYEANDPRYTPGTDSEVLEHMPQLGTLMWVRPETGEIAFAEPVDYSSWIAIPASYYTYLVYLHGKDHPREHWPESPAFGRGVHERIKAWRYQIDYAEDDANRIADGGGADDIDLLSGFDVVRNTPDPLLSDLYIETDPALAGARGAWVVRVTVGVPGFLLVQGREIHWAFLRAVVGAPPPPAPGAPPEEILAWQAEPTVQTAYQAWKLSTMQFSPGTVQAIAADNAFCGWRVETNGYHYYQKTRIPTPNGRSCEEGAYVDPPEFVEIGTVDLTDFIAYSNDQVPVVKHFDLELYPVGEETPFQPGEDPPGWYDGGLGALRSLPSRY
jgi:hypothetical protein